MGILLNALAIVFGSLLGSKMRQKAKNGDQSTLGIAIIVASLAGFFENLYIVQEGHLVSNQLLLLLLAFLIGTKFGQWLRIDESLSKLSNTKSKAANAVIDTALYFGIGGLQISGSMALVLHQDNSLLVIKSIMDVPFAIVFGATYGAVAALSAIPVAVLQILIALTTWFVEPLLNQELIDLLCTYGYIILFFSGYNLITRERHKVNNINMLPGILVLALMHIIMNWAGILL